MAEMAIGYGSEYQLLRYLGHHRRFLFQKIKDVIHTQEEIEWIDYPVDEKLCYISFLNGYKKTPRLNVGNVSDWEKIWNEEYHNLQLTEEQKKNIFHVYIDCSKG